MSLRLAAAAALGLVLLAPPVLAQSTAQAAAGSLPLPVGQAARPLTLAEAEALLVERNLAVIAARRGVDAAQANRLVAASLPPPQVVVGNSFAEFRETAAGAIKGARFISPSHNIAAGLQVLVERGGKRRLRTRVAEDQIGQAEALVLDAVRTQLFTLRQAFLGALLARANLEVALGNRMSLDRTEALLRRQLRDGAIPEGDLLRFQASRLQFESDVTSNAQAYAAGVAAVAALLSADPAAFQPGAGQIPALGINPSQPGALAPPPPGPRGRAGTPPGPASAPTSVQTILSPVAFDIRGRFDQVPALGIGREELAAAIESRADVVAAQRQFAAASSNRLLAEAGRSRDVTLNGSWSRSRLSQDLPESTDRLNAVNSFGIQLSVPIFTRQIVEGNVGIASAQAGQAEAQARAALLQARAEFAAAWAGYEQARALINLYAGGTLNRAEAAYRSTEQAYLAGGRALLDVLDALRVLNATRLQANQARYAYLLALAQLEQATGVSGIAPKL
ncbi:TolC family protein [Roseicella aerolata]|uniref:TolC family protein n=1 Tax=Roseicella aerolata TaxID=2883479 RepID=A0A9X1L934_9PROT|nr:TolC family protein [Roseicella aerolata]MCB4823179.1 TolC family protein [Roseicella aerolata]